jgi:glutaredoxin
MPRSHSVIAVTIYSRQGCHLCEQMKAVVERVGRTVAIALEEIDISTDPALEARYGVDIPVLMVGGRKVAKYRVTEEELRRILSARTGGGAAEPQKKAGGNR